MDIINGQSQAFLLLEWNGDGAVVRKIRSAKGEKNHLFFVYSIIVYTCIHDKCVYNKMCFAFAICLDNIHSSHVSSVLTCPFVSTHMHGVFCS